MSECYICKLPLPSPVIYWNKATGHMYCSAQCSLTDHQRGYK